MTARLGVELTDYLEQSSITVRSAYWDGSRFRPMGENERGNYSDCSNIRMMTLDKYNRMEGSQAVLEAGEVLVFSTGMDFGYDTVFVGDNQWRIREELSECSAALKEQSNRTNRDYIFVFADQNECSLAAAVFGLGEDQKVFQISCTPAGDEESIDAFKRELKENLEGTAGYAGIEDCREDIAGQESMYGGLMFIGIFFGSIFLICLLIIMYYKQITEGFEDQKNFEIMQKVGMSDEEIRKTIKKQIRLVFALPLAGAVLHTSVGMNMVVMMMGAIANYQTRIMLTCAVAVVLVFALVYSICYKWTSATYYRIVKKMG